MLRDTRMTGVSLVAYNCPPNTPPSTSYLSQGETWRYAVINDKRESARESVSYIFRCGGQTLELTAKTMKGGRFTLPPPIGRQS